MVQFLQLLVILDSDRHSSLNDNFVIISTLSSPTDVEHHLDVVEYVKIVHKKTFFEQIANIRIQIAIVLTLDDQHSIQFIGTAGLQHL